MGMTAKIKITGKKTFYDGQTVYLIGGVKPSEFGRFWDQYKGDAFIYEWNDQQHAHHAMRSAIRHHLPEMTEWLARNNAVTTCWVDPDIFKAMPQDMKTDFPWGIGFKENDPLESWFVMRWS